MSTGQLMQLAPLLLIFILMYFMMIRPQRKKEKQVASMRSALKAGDEILTIGGIYGKVMKVKDDRLTIEVGAGKTKFEVAKWAVQTVINAAPESKRIEDRAEEKNEETPVEEVSTGDSKEKTEE